MKHIYKTGGPYKTEDGKEYSIKAVNDKDRGLFLANGWVSSLSEVKKPKKKAAPNKAVANDNQE